MTYQDPCPFCGARLVGFTKADFVDHLRGNGETLKARIYEDMVVASPQTQESASGCAGANEGGSE